MGDDRILPQQQGTEIEMWVDQRISDAAKYDNVELLDEGGVFSLHMLAARIYAAGWNDGSRAESERMRGAQRRRDEARHAAAADTEGQGHE